MHFGRIQFTDPVGSVGLVLGSFCSEMCALRSGSALGSTEHAIWSLGLGLLSLLECSAERAPVKLEG